MSGGYDPTETDPDATLLVADHDQRGKTEALAALDGLRNAVDVDELFNQLFAAFLVAAAPATVVTATAGTATSSTKSITSYAGSVNEEKSDTTKKYSGTLLVDTTTYFYTAANVRASSAGVNDAMRVEIE